MENIAGANVYYCGSGSPKQKPLIERINREFRKRYHKGADFNLVNQQKIDWIFYFINKKLRPCLNWRTSNEVFLENFK